MKRSDIARLLQPLARRIRLAIGTGIVRLVDDAGGLQVLQISGLPREVRDRVIRYQNYGYTSVPLPGAQVVLASVGGNRNHLVAVAVDDARHRKGGLEKGEAAMHNHLGDYIVIRNGRIVEVVAGSKVDVTAPEAVFNCASKVTLNTPLLAVTGAIHAGGNIHSDTQVSDALGSMQGMRVTYNLHVHGVSPVPTPPMS
ncbi:phage baseplate assembly protein V [Solimonas sp. SE-A11]|uniref:phage baseplate assembly protein V n=1 Tax=Solimonas sp. SE-A11 TaxID=3054954 RepID=UPI00259CFA8C|nr:phage baseplate assembly protein V [Solimonas sp. SE-A11]